MANAVIGALRVNLGLDSAQFQTGLKTGESALSRFASKAKLAFAAVAAAGVAMAGAMAVGIKKSIDEADEMSKAAQKFGTTTEELSRLKHAADLSGVSFEGMGASIRVLSRNMQEMANGANNTASQAFRALGVSVTNADGTLRSSTAVMTDVAARFAQMEDGAQKTALAMAIFGRSGTDLIPMLNAGADGLREMMEEADQLGIVIDGNTARAAEAFNDNLTRLQRVKDGLIMKITAQLLPALELLSEQFLKFVNNEGAVSAAAEGIQSALHFVAQEAGNVAIVISRLRGEIASLAEAGRRLRQGDVAGWWQAIMDGQNESAKMAEETRSQIEQIFSGSAVSQGGIQRRIDEAFGASGSTAAENFVANFETATTRSSGRVREAVDPLAREAARVFDATRTPLEQYQAQIARLNELLAAGAITQDTYNRAVIQAQDAFDRAVEAGDKAKDTFGRIGDSIGSVFASAFSGLIDGSRKVSDVLKGLLSQLASMALNSAFRALFGGTGGLFSSIFGGFRANGGPVAAGRAYVVGERGPELVVPSSSGTVIPNSALQRTGRGGASEVMVRGVFVDDGGVIKARIDETVTAGISEYDQTMPERIGGQMNQARRIGAI